MPTFTTQAAPRAPHCVSRPVPVKDSLRDKFAKVNLGSAPIPLGCNQNQSIAVPAHVRGAFQLAGSSRPINNPVSALNLKRYPKRAFTSTKSYCYCQQSEEPPLNATSPSWVADRQ